MIPSFDALPGGCLVTNLNREVRFANAYLHEELGVAPGTLVGRKVESLLTPASRIFYDSYIQPMLLHEKRCNEVDITLISATGERIPAVVSVRILHGDGEGIIWCIMRADNRNAVYQDLARARENLKIQAQELRDLSITDDLTGLPNRREFERLVNRELQASERRGYGLSIVMIDIDHFKSINDGFGHASGDETLRQFGAALRAIMRQDEVVARYGGEEFIACLVDCDGDGAAAFALRVHDAAKTVLLNAQAITVSIGVAMWRPQRPEALPEWTRRADKALYAAKAAGRNCTRFADDGSVPP